MKQAVRDLIFIGIFAVLLHVCGNIFILKGNGYGSDVTSFYELPDHSLDVVFFGSSHSYTTFSPKIIEEQTGLKSYNFATRQQPVYITYYYMVETLKTQSPAYFVLETNMFHADEEYMSEGVTREALDRMHMSANKIQAIQASVEDEEERNSYYLNIMKYHARYRNLKKEDLESAFRLKGVDNGGFIGLEKRDDVVIDNSAYMYITEQKEISSKNREYADKIIQLARERDIELIFVKSPCQLDEEITMYFNWVKAYAGERGLDYIDLNQKFEELDLRSGDFYDREHLSESGAVKASTYFSEYMRNKAAGAVVAGKD